MKNVFFAMMVTGLFLGGNAHAKTMRATELNGSFLENLNALRGEELSIEFRHGDEIPVNFTAEGDLLETSRNGVSYILVKRNFWIKLSGENVKMSLDGISFKPIQEMIKGSFTADASSAKNDGIANTIRLILKAQLR